MPTQQSCLSTAGTKQSLLHKNSKISRHKNQQKLRGESSVRQPDVCMKHISLKTKTVSKQLQHSAHSSRKRTLHDANCSLKPSRSTCVDSVGSCGHCCGCSTISLRHENGHSSLGRQNCHKLGRSSCLDIACLHSLGGCLRGLGCLRLAATRCGSRGRGGGQVSSCCISCFL